jgi:Tfp pilus assembly major pilin PilA
MSIFAVVVVLIVLVIADVVAKQVAEYEIANQITSADSSIHPSVTIQGFPFLTQVATRDLKEIDISASNVAAGPVTITSVSAKAKGVHVNGSFNGGEVDSISGTVFIAFGSLSSALSSQSQGIGDVSLTDAGPHSIKASFGIGGANLLTETGTVAMKGMQVSVTWSQSGGDSGGILGSILGSSGTLPPLSFTLPKLPAGLQVQSFVVTSTGVSVTVAAQHTTLSQ